MFLVRVRVNNRSELYEIKGEVPLSITEYSETEWTDIFPNS